MRATAEATSATIAVESSVDSRAPNGARLLLQPRLQTRACLSPNGSRRLLRSRQAGSAPYISRSSAPAGCSLVRRIERGTGSSSCPRRHESTLPIGRVGCCTTAQSPTSFAFFTSAIARHAVGQSICFSERLQTTLRT